MSGEERITCPACGGAGGGPFGPAGSAWDDERYVCPRCNGTGRIALIALEDAAPASVRPGLVKTVPGEVASPGKRKATG